MQGHLDWILASLYRGDYARMETSVKNILRTGLYQLKFSDRLPDFAVVDEAVKIAKRVNAGAGGLVNAVLRSYLRNRDKITFPSLDMATANSQTATGRDRSERRNEVIAASAGPRGRGGYSATST